MTDKTEQESLITFSEEEQWHFIETLKEVQSWGPDVIADLNTPDNDALLPFIRIRKGPGAWNDYVFNIMIFFIVVFGSIIALGKALGILFFGIGVVAFLCRIL